MKSKLIMAIWSVVIAFGLWVYVITAVSPGSETVIEGVPVSLQGQTTLQDRDLMVVKTLDTTVDIRLAGNRSDLVKLDKNDISVVVNVAELDKSNADANGVVSVFYTVRVHNETATVVGSNPNKVRIVLEERVARDIPVVVNYGDTKPAPGFEQEEATLDYQTIPVLGPKSVVDQIARAEVKVDLTDKKQTIEQTLTPVFINEDGSATNTELLKWEINEVAVMIPIKYVKEIPLVVTVVPGMGANQENTSIVLEYSTIRVAGSEGRLADLESITVKDVIDLGQILEDTTVVTSFDLPPEVSLKAPANANREKFTIQVSFPEIAVKELEIPAKNISFENLPENMQAEPLGENIRVRVRGSRELVEAIEPKHIRFTLDLTGAKVGELVWKLTVVMDEEYSSLAVMDEVSARISLERSGN